MALDYILHEAIKKAVEDEGQAESLASKIVAWVDGVITGNEDLDDVDSVSRRVRLIYEDTVIDEV